jgi:phosphate transport system protein
MHTTLRGRVHEPAIAHRPRYHEALVGLERRIQTMAVMAQQSLEEALDALVRADAAAGAEVVADDDAIDAIYQDIERAAIDLMGRQQPVASELRFLVGLLHVALHLERIGDLAVEVAAATLAPVDLPGRPEVADRVREMGALTAAMTEEAVAAFVRRDLGACEAVAGRGVQVHALDRALLDDVLSAGDQRLPCALGTLQIGRHLERAAEHSVDIAEQAWFLVTGELRELA